MLQGQTNLDRDTYKEIFEIEKHKRVNVEIEIDMDMERVEPEDDISVEMQHEQSQEEEDEEDLGKELQELDVASVSKSEHIFMRNAG